MLGFAFSEAQRSQEAFLRLKHNQQQQSQQQQQHQHSPYSTNPRHNSYHHHQQQYSNYGPPRSSQSVYSAANSSNASSQDDSKKSRRKRRQRKPKLPEGGVVSTPASLLATTSSSTAAASLNANGGNIDENAKSQLYFSLRCGLVGTGSTGSQTALGRVVLVNWDGQVLVDAFIKVPVPVVDYCTEYTGIEPGDLTSNQAMSLDSVRAKVSAFVQGKVLIGHGLQVDLSILRLSHPECDVRDIATYKVFMEKADNCTNEEAKSESENETLDVDNTTNKDTAVSRDSSNDDDDIVPKQPAFVPRDVDILTVEKLKRGLRPFGYRLYDEAVSCIDLYNSVSVEWEKKLAKELKIKERERTLLVKMRFKRSANTSNVNKNGARIHPGRVAQPVPSFAENGYGHNGYAPQPYQYPHTVSERSYSSSGQQMQPISEQYYHGQKSQYYNPAHHGPTGMMNPNAPQFDMMHNKHTRASSGSLASESSLTVASPAKSGTSQSSGSSSGINPVRSARSFFNFGKNRKSRLEAANSTTSVRESQTSETSDPADITRQYSSDQIWSSQGGVPPMEEEWNGGHNPGPHLYSENQAPHPTNWKTDGGNSVLPQGIVQGWDKNSGDISAGMERLWSSSSIPVSANSVNPVELGGTSEWGHPDGPYGPPERSMSPGDGSWSNSAGAAAAAYLPTEQGKDDVLDQDAMLPSELLSD